MSIHQSFPQALTVLSDAPQPAGGATTHGNPPATHSPEAAGPELLDELRARAVSAGIAQLDQPTPADRVDAQMRDGMLARVTEDRWIDRQPLIDKVLFWAVIATCLIGGMLVFVQAVGRWL